MELIIITQDKILLTLFAFLTAGALTSPFLGFLLFCVSIPLEGGVFFSQEMTLVKVCGLIAVISFLIGLIRKRHTIQLNTLSTSLIIMAAWTALALAFSPYGQGEQLVRLLLCTILVVLTSNVVKSSQDFAWLAFVTALSTLLGFTLSSYYMTGDRSYDAGRLGLALSNANTSAFVCGLALLLLAINMSMTRKLLFRIIGIPLCFVLFFALLLTGSRGMLLAFIGAGFIYLFTGIGQRSKQIILPTLSICFLFVVIIAYVLSSESLPLPPALEHYMHAVTRLQAFITQEYEVTENPRVLIWEVAVNLFIESPLFGHGIGSFNLLSGASTENTYFTVIVELGLVGFIPFAVGLSATLLNIFKYWPKPYAVGCLSLFAFCAVASLSNDFLLDKLYWIILAICWCPFLSELAAADVAKPLVNMPPHTNKPQLDVEEIQTKQFQYPLA